MGKKKGRNDGNGAGAQPGGETGAFVKFPEDDPSARMGNLAAAIEATRDALTPLHVLFALIEFGQVKADRHLAEAFRVGLEENGGIRLADERTPTGRALLVMVTEALARLDAVQERYECLGKTLFALGVAV